MARQGTWADNIIIQAVANSLNITINTIIIESNANFPSVTVIDPVNTDRQTTNIGHIREYHYMSTMPVLNSSTYEMICGSEPIQKSAISNQIRAMQTKTVLRG